MKNNKLRWIIFIHVPAFGVFFFLFFWGGSCREIVAHTVASCLHLPLLRLLCVSSVLLQKEMCVCVCVCSCKRLICLWIMQRDTFACVCVLARDLYVFGLCKERHLCVCVCVCVCSCKKFVERVTRLVSNFSKASSVFWSATKFSNFGGWVGGEGFALAKTSFRSIVYFFLGWGEISPTWRQKKMAVRIPLFFFLKNSYKVAIFWGIWFNSNYPPDS